jgi:hypothetical protein
VHDVEKQLADLLEMPGPEPDVGLDADALLDGLEVLLEVLILDTQGDLAEQLDESPVRVVHETLVPGLLNQTLQRSLV